MADIDMALRELKNTLLSIKFFDVALLSLVTLAAGLVATTYFSLPWHYALGPFAIVFAYLFVKRVNVYSFHEVEQKVPQLREALQTAADTRSQEGILVHELHAEVLEKMRGIKSSYFLGLGTTTRQLLLLAGLSFLVIGLSAFNVNFTTTTAFMAKQPLLRSALESIGAFGPLNETPSGRMTKGKVMDKTNKFIAIKDNTSLYGDEADVILGDAPLELQVDPEYSGANLQDPHDAQSKDFRTQAAGVADANAQGACTSECDIPKDQQDIVKTYFEKVGQ